MPLPSRLLALLWQSGLVAAEFGKQVSTERFGLRVLPSDLRIPEKGDQIVKSRQASIKSSFVRTCQVHSEVLGLLRGGVQQGNIGARYIIIRKPPKQYR